jgi:hypothetical protein
VFFVILWHNKAMKKYTLFLFALAFLLGSFTSNVNFTEAANCAPGDLFNSVTGERCGTTTTSVVECSKGDLFNTATGARCTAWPTNSSIDENQRFSLGARGAAVLSLQQMLLNAGFSPGKIDGIYGRLTDQAYANYRNRNIQPTPCPAGTTATGMTQSMPPHYICTPTISSGAPVISGVSGPQSLNVNQQGTWSVTASSSNGGNLSYSVNWGDEVYAMPMVNSFGSFPAQQSATLTHTYSQAGTYRAVFTVTSENTIRCITTPCPSNGGTAQTSLSVNVVGNVTFNSPSISSLSPNSGVADSQVTIYGSGFTATGNQIKFGDLGIENNPRYSLNSNGSSITFTVPSSNYMACWDSYPACYMMARDIVPGVYQVSVINENGTSNAINFTVTAGTTY